MSITVAAAVPFFRSSRGTAGSDTVPDLRASVIDWHPLSGREDILVVWMFQYGIVRKLQKIAIDIHTPSSFFSYTHSLYGTEESRTGKRRYESSASVPSVTSRLA